MKKIQSLKRLSIFIVLLTSVLNQSLAQDTNEKKLQLKFSGFVKSYYWLDSRQIDGSRDELLLYYPKKPVLDANGADIHSGLNSNYSAINTRLSLSVKGPQLLHADVNAFIEGDFTGVSNSDINGLRLRHAFIRMKWAKDELLLGQYWHPMFVPEVFPEVQAFNTGAPFQPFIRNPQISYKHQFGKLKLEATLIMQRDNSSDGPMGRSYIYMQQTGIPNSHLQMSYKTENHTVGLAFDHKAIRPRLASDSNFRSSELVSSVSWMAYYKYTKDLFSIQLKTIYGQNLTEHLMLGGYAVAHRDPLTGIETYTPTNHIFVWGGINYGDQYRFGLFGGFAENLGTTNENIGIYYGKGTDVKTMFRIAPQFCFTTGPLQLASEIEYTSASMGTPDAKGLINNTKTTGVFRLLLVATYVF